jgi:hypothetical protein
LRGKERSSGPWSPGFGIGCLLYGILFLTIGPVVMQLMKGLMFLSSGQVNVLGALVLLIAVFLVPALAAIGVVMLINAYIRWMAVTRPVQKLERQILDKKDELLPAQARVEEEYQRRRGELEKELKQLEAFREKCWQKQYI